MDEERDMRRAQADVGESAWFDPCVGEPPSERPHRATPTAWVVTDNKNPGVLGVLAVQNTIANLCVPVSDYRLPATDNSTPRYWFGSSSNGVFSPASTVMVRWFCAGG